MPIGTRKRCLMKKTGHEKSRDTVPLNSLRYLFVFNYDASSTLKITVPKCTVFLLVLPVSASCCMHFLMFLQCMANFWRCCCAIVTCILQDIDTTAGTDAAATLPLFLHAFSETSMRQRQSASVAALPPSWLTTYLGVAKVRYCGHLATPLLTV
jgi:hypothetical protein